jgi:hypothetical protein
MKNLFFLFICCCSCLPVTQSASQNETEKILQLADRTYEPQIKTVRLFPAFPDPNAQMLPAVTQLGTWNLSLQFDDLRDQNDSYYARIIHCNQDWSKSLLSDLDFMHEFNEFPLNTFTYSLDTQIPYVHYSFRLPAVKLPGNYVIVVYRGSDRDDIILSRRFMVYEQRISFSREDNLMGASAYSRMIQQLNFTVNYKNVNLINPIENVNVSMRQNQRWDVYTSNIKPSFINENIRQLEYRFFDPDKMFKGGNEFRWFDLRSLNYPGRNVDRVNRTKSPVEVFIQPDKSRHGEAYAIYRDLNGNYTISNLDYSNAASGNYVQIYFVLKSATQLEGDVYVSGAFTDWSLQDEYKMQYDATTQQYTGGTMLRQGWYDYQYVVKSNRTEYDVLEGNHYETENEYEIFVYYRSFQPQADLLIGYLNFIHNPR